LRIRGIRADRGRLVREAIAVLMADLEAGIDASVIAQRLRAASEPTPVAGPATEAVLADGVQAAPMPDGVQAAIPLADGAQAVGAQAVGVASDGGPANGRANGAPADGVRANAARANNARINSARANGVAVNDATVTSAGAGGGPAGPQ
jgi:hypothetical protein